MTLKLLETNPELETSLVFLHGAGLTGEMWRDQMTALSEFHCIAPDLPGHGESNQIKMRSFEHVAQLVAEEIKEHATNGQAHIVGLSMGGYVAMQLLADYPEHCLSVTTSGITTQPIPRKFQIASSMMALVFPLLKTSPVLKAQARALKMEGEDAEYYADAFRKMTKEVFTTMNREMAGYHLPEKVFTTDHHVLALAGEHEQPLVLEGVREIVEKVPNAVGRIAPNVNHGWSHEAPELFTDTVRAWVNDAPLPDVLAAV